ncbi:MAG TPA: DNA repair protein RecN, partial [Anaerolineae bacterium]|nr:DNA repair protein RecN [Anaerolineae bacterium]
MLTELRIRNFAIIEELHLTFEPGLNVLTGETGAGKSIIVDAVSLLLGGRALEEMIRAEADRAELEGVFLLPPTVAVELNPILEQNGLEGEDGVLILAREIRRSGHNVARVNGRAVTVSFLAEIGNRLVDIHGQGEHLSLLRVREHINLLDRYAGLAGLRAQVAGAVRKLNRVRSDLAALRRDERELARRIDLLTFQVEEIRSAGLQPGEEAELEAERRRLANAEQLIELTAEVAELLNESAGERPSAVDLVGEAVSALTRLIRLDPDLAPRLEQAELLADGLAELAREVVHYRDGIEFNPHRLNEVEERLELIFNLKRKYGDTIEEILAFGEAAQAELDQISHAEERLVELESEEERLLREIGELGEQLSLARQEAAERLSAAVEAELADLRMDKARFGVKITQREDPSGAYVGERRLAFDRTGIDRVEFLVSANPGEPLRPLARVASGGEASRLMLALKTVLSHADAIPTLIFDEIDVGIGGRVGGVVGRKMWLLSRAQNMNQASRVQRQVLCVTHLPQLAAYGDLHYHISKKEREGRTVTQAARLDSEARIAELTAM